MKLKKEQNGFTLIEVIVTVVIMGIALLPLSALFNLSLNQTSQTGEQLVANQLAQSYIEIIKAASGIKAQSNVTLKVNASGINIEEGTDEEIGNLQANLMATAPGYEAKIEIIPPAAGEEIAPSVITETEDSEPVERKGPHMEILLSGSGELKLILYKLSETGEFLKDEEYEKTFSVTGPIKDIEIDMNYMSSAIEESLTDIQCQISYEGAILANSNLTGVSLDKSSILKITNDLGANVNISNKTITPVILELHTNTDETKINLKDGMIIKQYNPVTNNIGPYMIYKVKVTVTKEGSSEALVTLETTKLP